jgi:hypothetical protein
MNHFNDQQIDKLADDLEEAEALNRLNASQIQRLVEENKNLRVELGKPPRLPALLKAISELDSTDLHTLSSMLTSRGLLLMNEETWDGIDADDILEITKISDIPVYFWRFG